MQYPIPSSTRTLTLPKQLGRGGDLIPSNSRATLGHPFLSYVARDTATPQTEVFVVWRNIIEAECNSPSAEDSEIIHVTI